MQHERKPVVKKGLIYEKEAKVQTLGEIFINLSNKPQHLAKTKTPTLLKIPNKGVTNLRE